MPGFDDWIMVKNAILNDEQFKVPYRHQSYNNIYGNLGSDWTTLSPVTPGTTHVDDSNSLAIVIPATTPKRKFLLRWCAMDPSGSMVGIVYDRLASVSADFVGTGTKTINSLALPRYTTGWGVQVMIEQIVRDTGTSWTANLSSYTNSDGSIGRVGPSVVGNTGQRDATMMSLQAGDMGVRSVESINVTASAGATSNVNIVLVRPLAAISLVRSVWRSTDFFAEVAAFPRIFDGATLAFMTYALDTSDAGNTPHHGSLDFVYG